MRWVAFVFLLFASPLYGASFSGKPIQGGFMIGTAPEAKEIFLDGRPLPLTRGGKFILGFGRDYKNKAILKIKTKIATKEIVLKIKQRIYDIQSIDGIDEKKVTPPPSAWPQIKKESRMKAAARQKLSSTFGWEEKFIWPMNGQITGVYGSQRVLNGKPKRPHYGIDIAAPAQSLVVAPAAGTITLTGEDFYFEGGLIFLDHGFGLSSAFLHLGKVLVRQGQKVQQGDVIAHSGNSGRSTGAHLDWRIKWHKQNLDPRLVVGYLDTCVRGAFVLRHQATCYETKANSEAAP
jgi:murein DD-endopeptidase MepM/ murein hydrolase activator NlpD